MSQRAQTFEFRISCCLAQSLEWPLRIDELRRRALLHYASLVHNNDRVKVDDGLL
jgi:hypothetical protein